MVPEQTQQTAETMIDGTLMPTAKHPFRDPEDVLFCNKIGLRERGIPGDMNNCPSAPVVSDAAVQHQTTMPEREHHLAGKVFFRCDGPYPDGIAIPDKRVHAGSTGMKRDVFTLF